MNKCPILLAVLCLGLLGQDRQPKPRDQADNGRRLTLHITGHVVQFSVQEPNGTVQIISKVIETKSLTISADDMKYNQDTGEIEPRGNVRLKLN